MKSFILKSFIFLLGMSALVGLSSCLKDDFDTPPTNLPEIKEEQIISFEKLFEKLKVGVVTAVQEDVYLEALVVADDKSGNIYKNLVLHDLRSENGITISIDENEIHALYPVGQVVYVSLKNISVGYFEGLPSLGMNESNKVGRIPASLLKSVMIKSGRTLPVVPKKVKVEDLGSKYYSTLIELEGMQFETATSTTTYADPNPEDPQSVNHNIQNCTGGKLVLRNSGFADFAGLVIPSGNGKLVAVYSYYRSAAQLLIRDVNDLSFTDKRCDGSGGGTSGSQISIQNLRAQFTGTAKTLTNGFVKGIVISDVTNKNINGQNMVVQEATSGILLRFKSAVNIPLGSEVKVGLSGGELSEFKTLLQVQNLEATNIEVLSSGNTVAPKVLTASQVDVKLHESTLVRLENVTISGGTKYSGTLKISDASGQIDLYTVAAATFSGSAIPTGSVTVTAYVSEFDGTKQLSIRNLNDVTGGGPCDVTVATADCDGDGVANGQDCSPSNAAIFPGGPCDDGNAGTVGDVYDTQCACKGSAPGAGINEPFSSQTNNMDIQLSGWVNVAVKGTRKWQGKLFSGNTYAQATAFNDTAPEMETWLITPVINTATASTLTFETAKAFWVHEGLTVLATANFTGDPSTTTWTKVNAKIVGNSDADNTFVPSGNVDLKSFGANVRVAFKYEGKGGTNTSTFRIDNVKVQ